MRTEKRELRSGNEGEGEEKGRAGAGQLGAAASLEQHSCPNSGGHCPMRLYPNRQLRNVPFPFLQ